MEIKGYKAFNEDMTNNYGVPFEEGKSYHRDGEISFGLKGNGYHFCKNIEDTFRYVDGEHAKIAEVTGSGTIVEGFDKNYDYYDMYSASDISIDHIMSREEILRAILRKSEDSACRFIITGFSLTDKEIELFNERYNNSVMVRNHIAFYKLGDEEAFNRSYDSLTKIYR